MMTSLTHLKYLTPEEYLEVERLLAKYRKKDLVKTTGLLLMLRAGPRPQEVINLTWDDIDLERGAIYIRSLKNGRPRMIPYDSDLASRLRDMRKVATTKELFTFGYKTLVRAWLDYRPVKKRLHCLRHTFAVNLYKKSGHNLRLVQKALGHGSLQTTAIYLDIEVSVDELRAVMGIG